MSKSDLTLYPGNIIEFILPPIGLFAVRPYKIYSDDGLLYVKDRGGMKRYFFEWARRSEFRLIEAARSFEK